MGNTNNNIEKSKYKITHNDIINNPNIQNKYIYDINNYYRNIKLYFNKIKINIDKEKYKDIDKDLLEIKLFKLKLKKTEEKYQIFLEKNKDIPLYKLNFYIEKLNKKKEINSLIFEEYLIENLNIDDDELF